MLICGDLLLIVFTHYYANISACFLQCNDTYHGSSYRLAMHMSLFNPSNAEDISSKGCKEF